MISHSSTHHKLADTPIGQSVRELDDDIYSSGGENLNLLVNHPLT